MKRGLIIGGGVFGVIVIAIIVVVVVGLSNIDSIIKDGVETQGTKITQAKVTLDEVNIEATSGIGELRGLVIGNPKGFKTDYAFSLGGIKINIDIGTVLEDKIVIREIAIDAPAVTYEIGDGGSNIDALKRNIQKSLGGDGKPAAGEKPAEPAKGKDDGKKLIIDHVYIRGGKVSVSASMLGGRKLTSPLPDLHLKDIGKKKGGATPAEAVAEVMNAVEKAATGAVASLNVKGLLGGVGKAVGEQLKGVGGGDAGKVIEQGTEGVGKTLKGLFGK